MTISTCVKTFAGGRAAAFLLLALGACSTVISSDERHGFYHPGLVQYVASKGSFPVVIIANPFGAGTEGALLTAMQLPGYYPPTLFQETSPEAREDGHLVLIFNPIHASSGDGACIAPASQAATAAGAADILRPQIAFCYGRDVVSEAILQMPRPAGLDDPAFGDALSQLLQVLLPNETQNDGDCGGVTGVAC